MMSFEWKPVVCAEERGDMGELRTVEHHVGVGFLDKLQGLDGTSGEPSQQESCSSLDDKCLD